MSNNIEKTLLFPLDNKTEDDVIEEEVRENEDGDASAPEGAARPLYYMMYMIAI